MSRGVACAEAAVMVYILAGVLCRGTKASFFAADPLEMEAGAAGERRGLRGRAVAAAAAGPRRVGRGRRRGPPPRAGLLRSRAGKEPGWGRCEPRLGRGWGGFGGD